MGWTEDRVDTLKTLWAKGLTASQIAIQLGQGVTRNAVIGKVHRLKLAARAKPATVSARTRAIRRPRKPPSRSPTNSNYSATKRRSLGSSSNAGAGATAHKPANDSAEELKIARKEAQELYTPPDERVSLLELTEDKCKFPVGDPLRPDFYFCGRKSLEGKPYCEFHTKRACHNSERKKR